MLIAAMVLLGAVAAGLVSIRDATASETQSTSACATGGAVPDPPNNPGQVSDCEALLASRDALGVTAMLNWASDIPIAAWYGVTLGGTPRRVIRLKLDSNRLTGVIPAELGNLSNLQSLHLSGNQLTGELPAELGDLSNLKSLHLWDNRLTGDIPAELGDLSNLKSLYLWDNRLTGDIPTELGDLSNLQSLSLWGNRLTGDIPAELGSLSNLKLLYLSRNELIGCIARRNGKRPCRGRVAVLQRGVEQP